MGHCSGPHGCQPGAHNSPCVCGGSQGPVDTLSPALITPLSAPNRANTSGEFKPLTSQEFLCNNRLSFWRFNSIHSGQPSGEVGLGRGGGAGGCQGLPPARGGASGPPSPTRALGDQTGHLPWAAVGDSARPALSLPSCWSPWKPPRGGFGVSAREWPGPWWWGQVSALAQSPPAWGGAEGRPWGARSAGATEQREERRGQKRDTHVGCRAGPRETLGTPACGAWAGASGERKRDGEDRVPGR